MPKCSVMSKAERKLFHLKEDEQLMRDAYLKYLEGDFTYLNLDELTTFQLGDLVEEKKKKESRSQSN